MTHIWIEGGGGKGQDVSRATCDSANTQSLIALHTTKKYKTAVWVTFGLPLA